MVHIGRCRETSGLKKAAAAKIKALRIGQSELNEASPQQNPSQHLSPIAPIHQISGRRLKASIRLQIRLEETELSQPYAAGCKSI